MESRKMTLAALLIIGLSLAPLQNATAAQPLGLHVTQEELNIWRQRAVNGPYKTKGDVSTNSPGDWNRIKANADAFKANPSADRYSGQPAGTCLQNGDQGPGGVPASSIGKRIKDAGFVYLVTGDTTYGTAVRDELIAQAQTPGVDFTDTARFCDNYNASNRAFINYPNWLARLTFAYDYTKDLFSAAQRTTMDAWLDGAIVYWYGRVHQFHTGRFKNIDTFTQDSDYVCADILFQGPDGLMYYGGPTNDAFNAGWSNTPTMAMLATTIMALMTDNQTYKVHALRFWKEVLMFSIWADGVTTDNKRWLLTEPALGWSYASTIISDLAIAADMFARQGDLTLYEYSTTHGCKGSEGNDSFSGAPKSVYRSIKWHQAYMKAVSGKNYPDSIERYGTDQASRNGDPDYLIHPEQGVTVRHRIPDIRYILSNLYFQDDDIRQVYMRTHPRQSYGYPSNPDGGENEWGGRLSLFPGMLFMFGQTEGKVWPYPLPGSSDSQPPAPPKNLKMVGP